MRENVQAKGKAKEKESMEEKEKDSMKLNGGQSGGTTRVKQTAWERQLDKWKEMTQWTAIVS